MCLVGGNKGKAANLMVCLFTKLMRLGRKKEFPRPSASDSLSGRREKDLASYQVNKKMAALVSKLPDVNSLRFRFLANPFPQSNQTTNVRKYSIFHRPSSLL
jgi:hypothetical protein